jgi:hypothetical protein
MGSRPLSPQLFFLENFRPMQMQFLPLFRFLSSQHVNNIDYICTT